VGEHKPITADMSHKEVPSVPWTRLQVTHMTRAGRTLVVFGIYLSFAGMVLLFAPAFVFWLFEVRGTDGLWARIAAMLLLIVGYLCVRSGWESQTLFCRLSVHTRSSVLFLIAAFVYMERASPLMLIFGVIDFTTAMWTASALRADAREAMHVRHETARP
jgi:hypothetical protein